jgi:antitoxin HicB
MRYPVRLRPEPEGSFSVSFPDVPEALTCGENVEDALRHAVDALESALDFYFDAKVAVPFPSRIKRGQYAVELPPSVTAKVLLYNEMIAQQVRPAEMARRLKLNRQEMTRMLDPRHTTKIDSIAAALKALGKTLEIQAV